MIRGPEETMRMSLLNSERPNIRIEDLQRAIRVRDLRARVPRVTPCHVL